MKDIYENWNLYKEEVELLQELENIFLEYDNKILNEGIMDKINDFLLKLAMKVQSLGGKALSLISGGFGVVNRFKKKNPTLAKAIGMVLAIAAVTAVMTVSEEAAAQVTYGGEVVSQEQIDAARAMMDRMTEVDPMNTNNYLDIAKTLDGLQATETVEQLEKLQGKLGDNTRDILDRLTKIADKDPEGYSKMVDAGEKLITQVEQGSSGTYAHIVDASEFGKPENIADAAKGFFSDYESQNQGKIDPFEYAEIMKGIEAYGETGKVPNDAPKLVQKVLDIVGNLADGDLEKKRTFNKLLRYGKTINIQAY
jgi:hypothetical protein